MLRTTTRCQTLRTMVTGKRVRGLTLVEMFVVIGICGTLALLLVPLALRSRARARTIVCSDNLKTLGQAYSVCLMESSGYLPDAYYTFQGSSGTYQVALKDAQGGSPNALFKGETSGALTCPADERPILVATRTMSGSVSSVPASYAYNVALPLMFRNVSRVGQPVNTVTFYDGDLSSVVGTWQHTLGWAQSSIRNRHGGKANYLYLDGHVETSGEFPDLAFDGGSMWVASSRGTTTNEDATRPGEKDDKETSPSEAVDFVIEDGEVHPNELCRARIKGIGSEYWRFGVNKPRVPVGARYSVNGGSWKWISTDIRGGEEVALDNVQPGDKININGKCTKYVSFSYSSNDKSGHCWALRNGDFVPAIQGAMGQKGVAEFLQPYVNPSGHLTIGQNDVIYLFEMSEQTDYNKYSSAGFQDLVMMVTFEKKKFNVGGKININPNNNSDFEFTLRLPDGFTVTRDDLHADAPKNHAGFSSTQMEYTGPAVFVEVKPKGNGNQNGLTLNGAPYTLENKYRHQILSNSMTVRLYNDARNAQGKAMGKWWIEINASQATIKAFKNN